MKEFSKSNKLKALISPKMIDLVTFIDNNVKCVVYTGGNILGLYFYLEMIGFPTILATSGHCYHNFSPSYFINNDTSTLQTGIVSICMRQKSICEFCERIGHNPDDRIIHCPKFTPPSLIIKMNQFNAHIGDEPTDPPREWNIQSPEAHFKYSTSPTKTSTVVSDIMGRINHHAIDNDDVKVHLSGFTVESNPGSVIDPDNTPLQSNTLLIIKWTISCNSPT